MSIAIIAGLGNPGQAYRNTRHNIGFELVDDFARSWGGAHSSAPAWREVPRFEAMLAEVSRGPLKLLLAKPLTYMNDSGRSLGALLRYYKKSPQELLVIYDDITLELGRSKLSLQGSAGGHNGVRDLIERVGPGFGRFRIGIGAKPNREMNLADYVLSPFSPEELDILKARRPETINHLRLIIDKGIEPALNIINQRTSTTHERNENK